MTRSYRNSTGGKRRRRKRRVKQRHRDAKRFRVRRGSEPMEFWRARRGCVDKTRFYSAKLARKAAEELGSYEDCTGIFENLLQVPSYTNWSRPENGAHT